MTATTTVHSPVRPYDQAALAALRAGVFGPVLIAGDTDYVAETAMWNTVLEHSPAVVVGATCAADVQAAVRFATRRGLPVAVAATGHGTLVPTDGAVLVTTRRMTGVHVDAAARTVRIEAGATWQQVIDAAAAHGLAPLAGSAPDVGAVGYTLGGGLSPVLGRLHGYAADHVRLLDVVTADARLRRVDPSTDADLFWAMRGGKSNFGIVTALVADLFPVRELYAGGLFFSGEHTSAVLRAWRDLADAAPDELSTSIVMMTLPPAPELPAPLRGRHIAHVRLAWAGDPARAELLLGGLRASAPILLDTVAVIPFTAVGSIHADPPQPLPAQERSALLRALPDAAVDAVAVAGSQPGSPFLLELRRLGGALSRRPAVANAVGNRTAAYSVFAAGFAAPGVDLGPELEAPMRALQPWTTGRRLPNFLSAADASPAAVRAAYDADAYPRLQRVKGIVDPGNAFRVNHNIPPEA